MLKKESGFTGIDITIAIIAVVLFTSIILSLMYNVKYQNLKQVYKLTANIYLTETLENIGIADYDNVISTDSSINTELIPELSNMFTEKIDVEKISDQDNTKEDLVKKVTVTISYKIGNKTYEEVTQRLKIKQ